MKGLNGSALAKLIGQRCEEHGVKVVNIDGVGIGKAVELAARNWIKDDVQINYIIGNAASPDKVRWYNYRAAMYDSLSEKINRGEVAIPPEEFDKERTDGLLDEFRMIHMEWHGTSMLIEGKDKIKKRGGHSPDVLDSIAYALLDVNDIQAIQDDYITSDTLIENT